MTIKRIIQTYLQQIKEMLKQMKLRLQDESNKVETQLKNVLNTLVQMLLTDFPNYQKQVDEQTLSFRQRHELLREWLALVESMIQKLSQHPFELTDREEMFLSRLFLASKLGSPNSIKSEVHKCLKDVKLMSDIVYLTLIRYSRVMTRMNSHLFVRAHLYKIGKQEEFYVYPESYSSCLSWFIKPEKQNDYRVLAEELTDSALKYCVEKRNIFKQCFYDFNFEKLMSDFEGCVSAFSEQFPIPIIDFVFSQEESDFFNKLLESLLTFESTFIDEKKKLHAFSTQIYAPFLKEISEKLAPILSKQHYYETRDFGDCPRLNSGYQYKELCSDLKYLIMTMTDVLQNKCQQTCMCINITPNECHRMNSQPHIFGKIVHTIVVMKPDETVEVDKLVREFFAKFP